MSRISHKRGSQDMVGREVWLTTEGLLCDPLCECARQDKIESELSVATEECPPWQTGHSRRSSCQENVLETHRGSGQSVSLKIGPSQRAGIQKPIRAGRSDVDPQGQSQEVVSGLGLDLWTQTLLSLRVEVSL